MGGEEGSRCLGGGTRSPGGVTRSLANRLKTFMATSKTVLPEGRACATRCR